MSLANGIVYNSQICYVPAVFVKLFARFHVHDIDDKVIVYVLSIYVRGNQNTVARPRF